MMRMIAAFIVSTYAVLLLAGSAAAECPQDWRNHSFFLGRTQFADAAFDSWRNEVLLYGMDSSLVLAQWDGDDWRRHVQYYLKDLEADALVAEMPFYHPCVAFDDSRGVLVVHGDGLDRIMTTWEFDSVRWRRRALNGPRFSDQRDMTYDSARHVMVLHVQYGGPQTWEWDGESWRQVGLVGGPNYDAFWMAYDPDRETTILLGGSPGDTWAWDGDQWTLLMTGGPCVSEYGAMAFNSTSRELTYVEYCNGVSLQTWILRDSGWESVSTSGPTTGSAALCDNPSRGGLTLVSDGFIRRNTWEWNGSDWTKWDVTPPGRYQPSIAFDTDRNVMVLSGGNQRDMSDPFDETWEWDGRHWRFAAAEQHENICYDKSRKVTVAYSPTTKQTHEWDGVSWRLAHSNGPANIRKPMLYSGLRNHPVVFAKPTTNHTVAWEWDGTTWTNFGEIAGTDDVRLVATDTHWGPFLLSIGDINPDGYFSWDGQEIMRRAPFSFPTNPVYDRKTGQLMTTEPLLRGTYGFDEQAETWRRLLIYDGPDSYRGFVVTYDDIREAPLIFGGEVDTGSAAHRGSIEQWTFGPISPNADLDGDADVDIDDLALVLRDFGDHGVAMWPGDVDSDGLVDINDLAEVLAHYGEHCSN